MNESDWVLVITTIFLGIVALITPTISEVIKRKFFSPVISTSFKEIPPYCLKTYFRSQSAASIWDKGGEPVFYFRFKVRNTGKSMLKNCEAIIEELWTYDLTGIPQRNTSFIDVNLLWADNNKQPSADIGKNRRKFCNLGHISSPEYQKSKEFVFSQQQNNAAGNSLVFLFELASYPNSQQNSLNQGRYAIKVVLYSDNAAKKEIFFQIAWSGKWMDTEEDFFKELVIKEISPLS